MMFISLITVLLLNVPVVSSSRVRLVDGVTANQGRVEVYYNSEWGTICDNGWDLNDARVICRQLGYSAAIAAPTNAHFGKGYWFVPVVFSNVRCVGTESDITYCSKSTQYLYCSHSEDASVVCSHEAVDNEDPVFSGCPEGFSVNTNPGRNYALVSWTEPIASDNIGIKDDEQSHTPGDIFELVDGKPTVYTVRYQIEDWIGNEAECIFNITVIDNEPPELQCPRETSNYYKTYYGYIHASTDKGSPNGTITWVPAVARDNSGIPPEIISFPNAPGDVYPMRIFPPYTTTIRATDMSGNFKECILHFAVIDTEGPVINCPTYSNNIVSRASEFSWSVSVDKASSSTRLYWPSANATDNAGIVMLLTSNYNPGDVFSARNDPYQITYTAIDANENVGNCSFFIKVEEKENPSVECPTYLQTYTDSGSRFGFLSWSIKLNDNFAVINCMTNDSRVLPTNFTLNNENITLEQNGSFPIGTTFIEYVATDMFGNTGNCLLSITVIDNESPSIVCPSNFSNYYDHVFDFYRIVTDDGQPYATVTWDPPEISDNTHELVTWESFPYRSGDQIPLREFPPYTLTMTATDVFGNNRSCSVHITIIDKEPPIISCPSNITNYHDTYYGIVRAAIKPGFTRSSVTWDQPTVSDNSGAHVSVTSSHQSGDEFVPKLYPPYEVEYIAKDEAGNANSCKFYFLVKANLSN